MGEGEDGEGSLEVRSELGSVEGAESGGTQQRGEESRAEDRDFSGGIEGGEGGAEGGPFLRGKVGRPEEDGER